MFDGNNEFEGSGYKSAQQQARNGRRFSEEDELLICALAKEKMMAYKIAIKFDTTAERIGIVCRAHGVELISRKNQKNKRVKQILELLQCGYSAQQIMNQVDCDREFIAQVRYRFGLPKAESSAQTRVKKGVEMAIKLVSDGMTIKDACKNAEVSYNSYCKHKKALAIN